MTPTTVAFWAGRWVVARRFVIVTDDTVLTNTPSCRVNRRAEPESALCASLRRPSHDPEKVSQESHNSVTPPAQPYVTRRRGCRRGGGRGAVLKHWTLDPLSH